MTTLIRWAALLLALVLAAPAAAAIRDPYQLAQIVSRSQRGEAPSSLVATLRSAKTTYAVSGSDFGRLRAAGVPNDVLDHLQQSFVNDVDLLVKYWVAGESMGRCAKCYPQQVQVGADGTVTQGPPPLRAKPGRPLGLPDWYRPVWTSFKRNAINVDEIRTMAADGRSEAEMLEALETRPLVDIIGVTGTLHLGRHLIAGISGAQLADLRDAGVPDAVLDKLQVAALAAYVEHLRLRYLMVGRGSKS